MNKKKQLRREGKQGNGNDIELSAPWGRSQSANIASFDRYTSSGVYARFIEERTRLHEVYIREEAKNKRMGLVLSFLLIVLATLIILFAPQGRETLSYWIGASLVIFSSGALGYGRVWGKAANISFGADQDRRDL